MNIRFGVILVIAFTCITVKAQHNQIVSSEPMVHDPVMIYNDSAYHIYSTGWGIQQMFSHDMKYWTVKRNPVMSVIPKWACDSVAGFEGHVWAPDVMLWHDRWWMAYSCSTFGKNGSAIGLLSTRRLTSHTIWKDEGCIVSSHENRDNWNAIDPNFIIDENDQPWLTYGSFWDGIQMVQLDTTLHIKSGCKPVTIARRYASNAKNIEPNPTSKFAGNNAIEAPFILRHGDYYYLFVSWDYCCRGEKSSYRVAVGRSKTVNGPYLDRKGKRMTDGGGSILLEGDKKEFEAMGHCSAYHLKDGPMAGHDVFICHGYSVKLKGAAVLVTREIKWTSDGWPLLTKL